MLRTSPYRNFRNFPLWAFSEVGFAKKIQWSSTGSSENYAQQDLRNVSESLLWHTISGIRVLELEERETHGL
jgi:hypothetical protein